MATKSKSKGDKNNYYYADTEEVIEIRYDKNGNEIERNVYRRPLSDPTISKDRILYLSSVGSKKTADGSEMTAGAQSEEIIREMNEIDKKNKKFNKKLGEVKDIAINDSKVVVSILQKWIGSTGDNGN